MKALFGKIHRFLRCLRWPLVFIVLLLLVLKSLFTTIGYPRFVCNRVARSIAGDDASCELGGIRGDPFTVFEIEGITYTRELPSGTLQVHVPKATVGLRRRSLMRGNVVLRSLGMGDATITLTPRETAGAVALENIACRAEHSAQDILLGTVGVTIGGLASRLDFELSTASLLYDMMEQKKDNGPADSGRRRGDVDPLDQLFQRLLAILQPLKGEKYMLAQNIPLRLNDGSVDGSVIGDFAKLDDLSAEVNIVLKDTVFGSTSIPNVRGSLFYANKVLRMEDVRCIMPGDELFVAGGQVDFSSGIATGLLHGNAYLATLLAISGTEGRLLPANVIMTEPIRITAVIDELPLDNPQALQAHGVIQTQSIYAGGLVISEASVRPSFQNGRLAMEDMQVKTAGRHPSVLAAQGLYLPTEGTFSAEVTGTLNLDDILERLGCPLPDFFHGKRSPIPLKLTVAPSSRLLDWREWDAAVECTLDRLQTGPLKWDDIGLKASLKEGRLHVDALSCRLANAPPNHFVLQGESSLDTWLAFLEGDEETPRADAHLSLRTRHGSREALAVDMRLAVGKDDNGFNLALEDGQYDIRPELLHDIFEKSSGLTYDEFPLAWEKCLGEEPIHSVFEMPSWPLRTGEWRLHGHLAARDVELLEVPLEEISAAYSVDGKQVIFDDVKATLKPSGTQGRIGRIAITYDPYSIVFTDMDVVGAPEPIEPWLYARAAREIYHAIWQEVRWSAETPPHIVIPDLQYHELPRDDYVVILKGTLDSRNAAYRDFQTSSASCRLDLSLPSPGVSVSDIRICASGEEALTGRVDIGFDNGVDGTLDLAFPAGEMDTIAFLKNTLLYGETFLDRLAVAPQTHFSCKGRFSYNNEFHFALAGKIDTPQLRFDNILLNDLHGDWSADNRLLRWNFPRGYFYDGQLTTTGNYDFGTHSGECIAAVRKIPLESLLATFGPRKEEEEEPAAPEPTPWWAFWRSSAPAAPKPPQKPIPLKGQLGCDAHVHYYTNWADRPLQLQGNARVEIQEADLWRVPILSSLGKILFTSDLGRISKLSADVVLNGERVVVPHFVTDGTLISLSGNGTYHLDTKQMRFNLTGEFIRSSSIFRWLLSPVAWLINAELSGTPENFSWRTTTMRKIFSSNQPSMNRLSSELDEPTNK